MSSLRAVPIDNDGDIAVAYVTPAGILVVVYDYEGNVLKTYMDK